MTAETASGISEYLDFLRLDPDMLLDWAGKVSRLRMFPYFDAAHYVFMCLVIREDMTSGANFFSRKHPLSCWMSAMLMCFSGSFLANFLLNEPVINPLKRHDEILLATAVWYLMFYSPFDVCYKLVKFLPIKIPLAVLKEVNRAYKVRHGVQHAMKIYPNAYLVIVLIGTVKGAGSGFMRSIEQFVRGAWVPANNEALKPSFQTKACAFASALFVAHRKTQLAQYPHELIYLAIVGFFCYFKLSSILLGIHDPLLPFENIFGAVFMGGIWDALSRAFSVSRERREDEPVSTGGTAAANPPTPTGVHNGVPPGSETKKDI